MRLFIDSMQLFIDSMLGPRGSSIRIVREIENIGKLVTFKQFFKQIVLFFPIETVCYDHF